MYVSIKTTVSFSALAKRWKNYTIKVSLSVIDFATENLPERYSGGQWPSLHKTLSTLCLKKRVNFETV